VPQDLDAAGAAALSVPSEIRARAADLTVAIQSRVVATRRDLHAHPELGFHEERTSALVAARLRELGFDQVRTGVGGTGVVGLVHGSSPGPVVAIRADMDALPIEEAFGAPYRSTAPNVMHACGHDAHTAMALGVAEVVTALRDGLPGSVLFLFQPAEEGDPAGGSGGAMRMIADGALANPVPAAIFGLHVHPALDTGVVGLVSGPAMASDSTFSIVVRGRKTHGAYPHTGLDPVPVAAQVVLALQTIPSRFVDAQTPTIVTIGAVNGGNRANIIADAVTLLGTVRCLARDGQARVAGLVQQMLQGIASAHGTAIDLVYDDNPLPVTYNDPSLCAASRPALAAAVGGGENVTTPPAQMGAEDFSCYQQQVPGLFFFLGTGNRSKHTVSMLHTDAFDIDEDALAVGVRAMSFVALDFLFRR
jgi:amidohydrolase